MPASRSHSNVLEIEISGSHFCVYDSCRLERFTTVQIYLCVETYPKSGEVRWTTFSACASVFATSCRQRAGRYDLTSGTRHIACELSISGIAMGINCARDFQQAKLTSPPKSHSASMPVISDTPGGLVASRKPLESFWNAQVVSEV